MTRPPAERGSQPERTRLAWRRTVLLTTVSTLLLVNLAVQNGQWWLAPLALAAWAAATVAAQSRIRALAADRTAPVGRALTVAALITLWYVGMGATVTVLSR